MPRFGVDIRFARNRARADWAMAHRPSHLPRIVVVDADHAPSCTQYTHALSRAQLAHAGIVHRSSREPFGSADAPRR